MRGIYTNLTVMTFGLLSVVSRVDDKRRRTYWLCKCACGTEKVIRGEHLVKGRSKSCGCARERFKRAKAEKQYSLVNQRFGRLWVLWRTDKGSRRSRSMMWECRCDCGKTTIVSATSLRSGRTKSCGCLQLEAACLEPGQSGFNFLLTRYKRTAEQRGLVWDLTEDQFRELLLGNCHYCGEPPKQVAVGHSTNGKFIYNGIDRLNNMLGYVSGNVVSCCGIHNRMKGTMSHDEFITACLHVASHKNSLVIART